MRSKKSVKSNLEKKTMLFFQMGLVIAMAGTLVAFEAGNSEPNNQLAMYSNNGEVIEDMMVPVTRPEPPQIAPPPMRPIEFIIIDDPTIELDENFDINIEINANDPLDYTLYDIPEDDPVVENEIFVIVEDMPKYQKGTQAKFQKHLQSLVKYPDVAIETGIEGLVYLNFIVDKSGKLTQANIVRSPHQSLSEAVLEAVAKTKRWEPGMQRGLKVPVTFTVPVNFKLN